MDHLRLKARSINICGDLKTNIAELDEYATRDKYDLIAVQEARLKKGAKLAVKGCKAFVQAKKMQSGTARGGIVLLVASHLAR